MKELSSAGQKLTKMHRFLCYISQIF